MNKKPTKNRVREILETKAILKEFLPDGTKKMIYLDIRHISRTGETKTVKVMIVLNGELIDITRYISELLGYPYSLKYEGLVCRADGGISDIVYHLSYTLFGDEYKLRYKVI